MPYVPQHSSVEAIVADLARRLDIIERTSTLNGSVLDAGNLVVEGGGAIAARDSLGAAVVTIDSTGISIPGQASVSGSIVLGSTGIMYSDNYVAGTSGWQLSHTGVAEFHSLVLGDGIVTNDALESPVVPYVDESSASNFLVPHTAAAAVCTVTVPVPSGYATAHVVATATLTVVNTGSSTVVHLSVTVDGAASPQGGSASAPTGETASVTDVTGQTLTGLSGPSFDVDVLALCNTADIPANVNTSATVAVSCTFTR